MRSFGNRLKEILTFFNLRYIDVAVAVGYDPSYISKWVKSVAVPASSAMPSICEAITNLIISKSKRHQISEFCALHDIYKSPEEKDNAFNDTDVLNADLYKAVTDMLMTSVAKTGRNIKSTSVKSESRYYGTGYEENRLEAIRHELEKIRAHSDSLNMKILYDLQKVSVQDIMFLADVQNIVNLCGFESGRIDVMISEESLSRYHSEKVISAFLNYIIQPSCIQRCFASCPIGGTGIVIILGGLMYKAGCETERGWIFENIIREEQEIARALSMIKAYVVPAAVPLFSEEDITDEMLGEKGGRIYWKITHDMLLSNMNSAYFDRKTTRQLFADDDKTYEAASVQFEQLTDNLANGKEHRCIIARQAMDDFVYNGKVRACGNQYIMPVQLRLNVLMNIDNLIKTYPESFKFRIVDRTEFSNVKHQPIPSLFGHDNSMRFLSKKNEDERRYCIVTNTLLRMTLMDFVNRLWANMFVTQKDTTSLMNEYIGYCREFS